MKTTFMLIFILSFSTAVFPAPLSNVPLHLLQPDGTTFSCFASGDEFFNCIHDQNGIAIVKDSSGFYVYADCISDELKPTSFRPGLTDPSKAGLKKITDECIKILCESSIALYRRQEFETFLSEYRTHIGKTLSKGKLSNICILLRFSDDENYNGNFTQFDSACNSSLKNSYSLKNYYKTVSYDQLDVTSYFFPGGSSNEILSFRDSHPRRYYRPYDPNTNPDGFQEGEGYKRLQQTLAAMIDSVRTLIPASVNLDINNDGFIDNICFIIKGWPEAWGSPLWPHCSGLQNAGVINGKKVNVYNLQFEMNFIYSILAHEFFHSLGAPDFYRYKNNGFPVGYWDIMANGTGQPLLYTKFLYGHWLDTIPRITRSGKYTLKPASSTGNAFIINSLPYPNEFYVLEFRRRNDFFEHLLYGTGLVVYRINTDLIGNAGGPPDEIYVYRYNGTIEQNGDIYLSYFSDKALNEMDAINDSTNPSGFLSNGIPGGLHIQNVKVYDDSLTFYAYIRPTLSLKYPNGGQLYSGFSKQKIEWKSTAIDSLNIEYSPDNGNSWHLIKNNLPADPSSFIWTLLDINTTLCKIRISNAAGPKISAVNPAPFSIKKLELLNLSVLNSIYIGAKSLRTASVNDYLFVASNDYLKIFNKKEPNEPLEISYNDKPSDIKNIVIEDNRAYVHCNYYGPYEQILKIYDISDPAKPVLLGQYWHIADNFTVKNKIIYMAAWDELHVVDAKDPAYPKAINNLKSSVVITTAVNDKYGYFGSRSGVKYFDISDPSKSVILNPADSTIPVSAMAISGKYLYALTIYGVIIYDLLDYGKPYERKLLKLPEMPGFSSHSQIYAAGNLLVISYPEAGMLIYDITDRLQPVLKSRFCANSETMGSSFDGIYFYIATFSEGIYIAAIPGPTDVESSAAPIIYSSSLEQNFPNPFNPLTTIRYSVSVNTKVLLKVYDVLGKEAAILVDEFKSPGNYSVDFNGSSLSSGIYFYRITCGNFTETKKLVLIK